MLPSVHAQTQSTWLPAAKPARAKLFCWQHASFVSATIGHIFQHKKNETNLWGKGKRKGNQDTCLSKIVADPPMQCIRQSMVTHQTYCTFPVSPERRMLNVNLLVTLWVHSQPLLVLSAVKEASNMLLLMLPAR